MGWAVLLCSTLAWTQEEEQAPVFDRPGVADGPYLVKSTQPQLELGWSGSDQSTWQECFYPSAMIRAKFWKRQEWRIAYNYVPQSSWIIRHFNKNNFSGIALGTKIGMVKEQGRKPEIALLINWFAPTQIVKNFYNGKKSKEQYLELGALFQNNWSNGFSLNYNLGALISRWSEFQLTQSICLSKSLDDNWALFVEQFGYFGCQSQEVGFDGGITYRLHTRHQLDLSYVFNYLSRVNYGTVLLGYSFRY